MPTLIVKTLGIPQVDQPRFPYAPGTAPKREILARVLCRDRSKVFRVIGVFLSQGLLSNDYQFLNPMASYDLSLVSHTNTLTESHFTLLYAIATGVPIDGAYVIFSTIDGVTSGQCTTVLFFGNVITRICVGQGVPIYTSDMELSTQHAHIQVIHECQDQFAASLSTMATDLHSLIPDDDVDGDNGDFTPDTSTT
ncbi:hypothetical protein F0562_025569 [Nyssa sinensis]|uniref:Uncharacterized protein n=1 Tax=Nyssa sinensis TaxID=561372 RepID=A0A5J5BAT7_9ASTE|nr:hypothetical protein F0562_025569 [Nyssa sinensis]